MPPRKTVPPRRSLTILALPLILSQLSAQEKQTLEERVDDLEKKNLELEQSNRDLERKLDILASDVEDWSLGDVIEPLGQSISGLGPAASKVYGADGLSIGGYGEALYQFNSGATDQFDALRTVFYFGYKFNDQWVLNTEIELEHAGSSGGGSTSVEFAYLDYLLTDELNLRGGLVLAPMGFVNELHEPVSFLPATRPLTETLIMPTTWRENGFGAYGDVGPLAYRAYVLNGFEGEGFSASGLRGGRQRGSRAKADDLAVVARVDWVDIPGIIFGGSIYYGNSGQDSPGLGDTTTAIYEAHAEYRAKGIWARALASAATVDDVAELNTAQGFVGSDSVGERLEGYYLECGYDVMSLVAPGSSMSISPYVRWESIDTQAEVPAGFSSDPANDIDVLTVGVNIKPIDQIVLKFDYESFDRGTDRFNILIGYIF